MAIEIGFTDGSTCGAACWPLAHGDLELRDVVFADRRLKRLAARGAPGVMARDTATGWLRSLEDALEPLLVGHRLEEVSCGDDAPLGSAARHALYRIVRGNRTPDDFQAWPLTGAEIVPRMQLDDVWSDFRAAVAEGRYFLAHDVLEPSWRATRCERMQTAIWVAAGYHQQERTRYRGATKLFLKAVGRMEATETAPAALIEWLLELTRCPKSHPTPAWNALVGWARQ